MVVKTTRYQWAKVAGAWAGATGLLSSGLFVDWIRTGNGAVVGIASGALLLGGAFAFGWGYRRYRSAMVRNRELLKLNPDPAVLVGRERTARILNRGVWLSLGALVPLCAVFFAFVAMASCPGEGEGLCSVSAPRDEVIAAIRNLGLVALGVYATFMSLRRVHGEETDKIVELLTQGERSRDMDDPFSRRRSRWE